MDGSKFWQEQLDRWPGAELTDLLKAAYQSVFGPGHFIGPEGESRLTEELAALPEGLEDRGVEVLQGPWCRFHLTHLAAAGLSPRTLYRLFRQSGEGAAGTTAELETLLAELEAQADAGALPWPGAQVRETVDRWRAAGFPPCHHSETVRSCCHPAYRVLHRRVLWFLPLLARIDGLLARQGGGLVALEGGSASGKTTLAAELERIYDCRVFHMDDFFLRPEQRTEARLAEPGGNVDRERFLEEVLEPVTRGETVQLRRYDCCTQTLEPPVEQPPRALTIVEGAYSLHPELAGFYDLKVFLSLDPQVQRARIRVRNTPEQQVRFFNTWIPLEQRYFQILDPKGRSDLVLEGPHETSCGD